MSMGVQKPTWDLASSSVVDNTHDIDFDTPSGSWGEITAVAICDALTNGNLLLYDNSESGDTPTTDDEVTIAAGALDISLS